METIDKRRYGRLSHPVFHHIPEEARQKAGHAGAAVFLVIVVLVTAAAIVDLPIDIVILITRLGRLCLFDLPAMVWAELFGPGVRDIQGRMRR
ncbi:MAG: hypothetical protein ACYCVW_16630 [Rhodocyclaceae bacterium]